MSTTYDYSSFPSGSTELINQIVTDHIGWATSIAKAVARAWNMDWQLDGLDGGAYEALLFCARRYDPSRGVPFRGYARKRIHEACTEESRKSKTWHYGVGTNSIEEQEAREVSARLLDIFPELREGYLPSVIDSEDFENSFRNSVRQLLTGANLINAFEYVGLDNPETAVEYKRLVEILAQLEPIHQNILWAIYYKGQSMRSLAEEWEIDDLSIIREHKEILDLISSHIQSSKQKTIKKLKIRKVLRNIASQIEESGDKGAFFRIVNHVLFIFVFGNILDHIKLLPTFME